MKFPYELNGYVSKTKGELPRWRISAVVWHGQGWASPCGIAQGTLHENDNHNSIHTGSVVARDKHAPSVAGHQNVDENYAIEGNNITRYLGCEVTRSSRKS